MLVTIAGLAVGVAAIGYVLAGVLLYMSQDALIFPGAYGVGGPLGALPAAAKEVDVPQADGPPLRGIFLDRPGADVTILFFGGNGETIARSVYDLDALRAHGVKVLMVDYPGYGQSPGKPSASSIDQAADAALDYLGSRPDSGKIIVAGRSLGTAPACRLGADDRVAALMLFAPFTTLAEAAGRQMPFFPVGRLLRHRFSNRDAIRNVRVPILLYHNRDDRIVPAWMSEELERLTGDLATRVVGASGGHNGIDFAPETPAGEAISAFLSAVDRRPGPLGGKKSSSQSLQSSSE